MTDLVLGTAQFGSGYGVTNTVGRLSDESVASIVALALGGGVRVFDTAAGYGDAERRLGAALEGTAHAGVITKFALPPEGEPVTASALFEDSLGRLGISELSGLLLHDMRNLVDPRWLHALDIVREGRADGRISRIGVSIYDVDDLERALEMFPDLDLVQVPGSVLDRRLLDSPVLAEIHDAGIEVHVRSVFLQGILLADPLGLDQRFALLVPHLLELRATASSAGIPVAELVVQQVRDHPVADALVVGATSVDELGQILSAFSGETREQLDAPRVPTALIDPRRW